MLYPGSEMPLKSLAIESFVPSHIATWRQRGGITFKQLTVLNCVYMFMSRCGYVLCEHKCRWTPEECCILWSWGYSWLWVNLYEWYDPNFSLLKGVVLLYFTAHTLYFLKIWTTEKEQKWITCLLYYKSFEKLLYFQMMKRHFNYYSLSLSSP